MSHYILYQAYGTIDHINECRYSLLKYLGIYNMQPPTETGIIIYTDQPAQFEAFAPFFKLFQIKEISGRQIREWRGNIDFVHRVKIEIINEFLENTEGSLIYLDTDTYINDPIEQIFKDIENGVFYMHGYEGVLDRSINPVFAKWDKFLSRASIQYNGKTVIYDYQL